MPVRLSSLRRFLAAFLALVTFLTGSPFAHAAESNIWSDRRKALSSADRPGDMLLASLPLAVPGVAAPVVSFPENAGLVADPALGEKLKRLPAVLSRIPSSSGEIRNARLSAKPGAPVVLLVQDAHQVLSAQKSIGRILDHVSRGLAPEERLFVGIEGTAGAFVIPAFRRLPDQALQKETAGLLFDRNLMTGAEYFGLTAEREPLLWGVEDVRLYMKNVDAYRRSLSLSQEGERALGGLREALAPLKEKSFSPELRALDDAVGRFDRGDAPLPEYVRLLASRAGTARFPEAAKFLAACVLEESLDFKAVEAERAALVEKLAKTLDKAALEGLVRSALAFRSGEAGAGAFYGRLKELVRASGASLAATPAFDAYVGYALAAERIRPAALFDELEAMKEASAAALARTPGERAVFRAQADLRLAEALLRHELTADRWRLYQLRRAPMLEGFSRLPGGPSPDVLTRLLRPFEDFYLAASLRDRALVDNFMKTAPVSGAPAVLIAGGFHTAGLEAELFRRGASVVTVAPRLDDAPRKATAYLDVFGPDRTPLEKMLLGERLTTNPPSAFGAPNKAIDEDGGLGHRLAPQRMKGFLDSLSPENRKILHPEAVASSHGDVSEILFPKEPGRAIVLRAGPQKEGAPASGEVLVVDGRWVTIRPASGEERRSISWTRAASVVVPLAIIAGIGFTLSGTKEGVSLSAVGLPFFFLPRAFRARASKVIDRRMAVARGIRNPLFRVGLIAVLTLVQAACYEYHTRGEGLAQAAGSSAAPTIDWSPETVPFRTTFEYSERWLRDGTKENKAVGRFPDGHEEETRTRVDDAGGTEVMKTRRTFEVVNGKRRLKSLEIDVEYTTEDQGSWIRTGRFAIVCVYDDAGALTGFTVPEVTRTAGSRDGERTTDVFDRAYEPDAEGNPRLARETLRSSVHVSSDGTMTTLNSPVSYKYNYDGSGVLAAVVQENPAESLLVSGIIRIERQDTVIFQVFPETAQPVKETARSQTSRQTVRSSDGSETVTLTVNETPDLTHHKGDGADAGNFFETGPDGKVKPGGTYGHYIGNTFGKNTTTIIKDGVQSSVTTTESYRSDSTPSSLQFQAQPISGIAPSGAAPLGMFALFFGVPAAAGHHWLVHAAVAIMAVMTVLPLAGVASPEKALRAFLSSSMRAARAAAVRWGRGWVRPLLLSAMLSLSALTAACDSLDDRSVLETQGDPRFRGPAGTTETTEDVPGGTVTRTVTRRSLVIGGKEVTASETVSLRKSFEGGVLEIAPYTIDFSFDRSGKLIAASGPLLKTSLFSKDGSVTKTLTQWTMQVHVATGRVAPLGSLVVQRTVSTADGSVETLTKPVSARYGYTPFAGLRDITGEGPDGAVVMETLKKDPQGNEVAFRSERHYTVDGGYTETLTGDDGTLTENEGKDDFSGTPLEPFIRTEASASKGGGSFGWFNALFNAADGNGNGRGVGGGAGKPGTDPGGLLNFGPEGPDILAANLAYLASDPGVRAGGGDEVSQTTARAALWALFTANIRLLHLEERTKREEERKEGKRPLLLDKDEMNINVLKDALRSLRQEPHQLILALADLSRKHPEVVRPGNLDNIARAILADGAEQARVDEARAAVQASLEEAFRFDRVTGELKVPGVAYVEARGASQDPGFLLRLAEAAGFRQDETNPVPTFVTVELDGSLDEQGNGEFARFSLDPAIQALKASGDPADAAGAERLKRLRGAMGKTVFINRVSNNAPVSVHSVLSHHNVRNDLRKNVLILAANPALVDMTGLESVVRFIIWTLNRVAVEATSGEIKNFIDTAQKIKTYA